MKQPHMEPFFTALQTIIRAGEPAAPAPQAARKPTCRWCGGTQERGEGGGGCSWCEPTDDIPEPTEAEVAELRLLEIGRAPMPRYPKF